MEDNFNINEAFRELEMVESQLIYENVDGNTFNLMDDDIEDLRNFLTSNDEEDDIQMIIDAEADEEEELRDDYVGCVVLQCPICRSLVYKDEESLVKDEDSEDLYNIEDECPHCHSEQGFELVGKVAPLNSEKELSDEELAVDEQEVQGEVEDEYVTIGSEDTPSTDNTDSDDINEEDVKESLVEDFKEATKQDYKIVKRFTDQDDSRTHVIAERTPGLVSDHDYIVCLGYDDASGTWEQGRYGYKSLEDAIDALTNGDIQTGRRYNVIEEECKEQPVNEEVDVHVKELDEELFDKLANKYMHSVYENVSLYKTTKGLLDESNNQVILEGVIKFNSGKEQNTKFVFESDVVTKKGKFRLFGLNETFSTSKKAFSLKCELNEGKLLPETLSYNYKAKSLNESRTVCGRAVNRLARLVEQKEEDSIELEGGTISPTVNDNLPIEVCREIFEETGESGGTFSLEGKNLEGTKEIAGKYAVGMNKAYGLDANMTCKPEFDEEYCRKLNAVIEKARELNDSDLAIGTWVDDGISSIDLVKLFADEEEAIANADPSEVWIGHFDAKGRYDGGIANPKHKTSWADNEFPDKSLDETIEKVEITDDEGNLTNVEASTDKVEVQDAGEEIEVKVQKDEVVTSPEDEEPFVDTDDAEAEIDAEFTPSEVIDTIEQPAGEEGKDEGEDEGEEEPFVDEEEAQADIEAEFDKEEKE